MLLLGLSACASTGERAVALESLPAAAQAALRHQANGATLSRVVCDKENGETRYEGRWTSGSVVHEATVTAQGTLVETESQVSAPQVPRAVRDAAGRLLGGASNIAYEKRTNVLKGTVTYSAEAKRDGQTVEIEFRPDGSRLSEEEAVEGNDAD